MARFELVRDGVADRWELRDAAGAVLGELTWQRRAVRRHVMRARLDERAWVFGTDVGPLQTWLHKTETNCAINQSTGATDAELSWKGFSMSQARVTRPGRPELTLRGPVGIDTDHAYVLEAAGKQRLLDFRWPPVAKKGQLPATLRIDATPLGQAEADLALLILLCVNDVLLQLNFKPGAGPISFS